MRRLFKHSKPEGHWLDRSRLRAYSIGLVLAMLIYGIRGAFFTWKNYGHPNGFDFVQFWAASRLALDGNPLAAYSIDALDRTALLISPTVGTSAMWLYPPNFLLVVWPLALMSDPVSYFFFEFVTSAAFVWMARRVLPFREAWLPLLAFPAMWLNIGYGQNAALTASLMFGAMLLLDKRPVWAGICIGLLSIKPQLAILFPVALICAGQWRTIVAAAVTAIVFTAVSVLAFGKGIVPVFLQATHTASHMLLNDGVPYGQMASVFAALHILHVPSTPAMAIQGVVGFIAVVTTGWIWYRCKEAGTRAVALIAGTYLTTPYLFSYDTVALGIPLVMYTAQALRTGWMRGEREIFVVAWVYAPIGFLVGMQLHFVFAPLLFGAMLWLAWRRAGVAHDGAADGAGDAGDADHPAGAV